MHIVSVLVQILRFWEWAKKPTRASLMAEKPCGESNFLIGQKASLMLSPNIAGWGGGKNVWSQMCGLTNRNKTILKKYLNFINTK